MKITWLGHSTFKIGSEKTIIIDPHAPQFGAMPADLIADIVTVSHAHHDHNYIAGVGGNLQIIDSTGEHVISGDASLHGETSPEIEITGVATFHDNEQGQKRGGNIVFIYEIEGLRISHLGDLGHLLNEDQLSQIGPVDILMIPVGGFFTIDSTQAVEVVKQIQPKIVLPMHYKTQNMPANLPIAPVDDFIQKLGWKVEKVSELDVDQNNISNKIRTVIVFA